MDAKKGTPSQEGPSGAFYGVYGMEGQLPPEGMDNTIRFRFTGKHVLLVTGILIGAYLSIKVLSGAVAILTQGYVERKKVEAILDNGERVVITATEQLVRTLDALTKYQEAQK